jgi:hydrogenase maturation protease
VTEAPINARLLVLGLGNPILRDDAAGLLVVDLVEKKLRSDRLAGRLDFAKWSVGNMDLVQAIADYAAVLVIDAFHTPTSTPGKVAVLSRQDLAANATTPLSAHLLDLPAAFELSENLGYPTPELIGAVVIEVGPECREFGEELNPAVEAALPEAARRACEIIRAYAE